MRIVASTSFLNFKKFKFQKSFYRLRSSSSETGERWPTRPPETTWKYGRVVTEWRVTITRCWSVSGGWWTCVRCWASIVTRIIRITRSVRWVIIIDRIATGTNPTVIGRRRIISAGLRWIILTFVVRGSVQDHQDSGQQHGDLKNFKSHFCLNFDFYLWIKRWRHREKEFVLVEEINVKFASSEAKSNRPKW